jgi:hypothetical protein
LPAPLSGTCAPSSPPAITSADAIAAQQLHALKQHYEGKLQLSDLKEMFVQMRDQP